MRYFHYGALCVHFESTSSDGWNFAKGKQVSLHHLRATRSGQQASRPWLFSALPPNVCKPIPELSSGYGRLTQKRAARQLGTSPPALSAGRLAGFREHLEQGWRPATVHAKDHVWFTFPLFFVHVSPELEEI